MILHAYAYVIWAFPLYFSQDLQLVQEDVSESLKVALTDFSNIEKDNVMITFYALIFL